MKRTFTLALTAVLGAMIATQSFAQEAFPDTPENHWAYEALAKMRAAGLLTGYPDGLYRGARPASRYEMAVALYALYQHLKGISDGLEVRIKNLEENKPMGGGNTDELRKMLEALRADVNGMKAWGDDIASLKKMAATFEKELASMGVDIEALKKGLNDLSDRVSALEKRKPAVDIHGNVSLFVLGGYSEDGLYGIGVDGRVFGANNSTGDPANFTRDLNVFHGMDVNISGTNDDGPKWKASLSINNMLDDSSFDGAPSGAFGAYSGLASGFAYDDTADTSIYFNMLEVSDKSKMLGQDVAWRMGRIGKSVHPYILKRPDNTPYFSNERWDDGNWYFDGADLSFMFGNSSLSMFGGRTSGRNSNNGDELNPMVAGQSGHVFEPGGFSGNNSDRPRGFASGELFIDTMFGAHLNVPVSGNGKLNLAYLILDSDTASTLSGTSLLGDRVTVFGGDVTFDLGGFGLNAGYSQTNIMLGDSNVIDEDNAAWWVSLGRDYDRWGFKVGYRSIDPQFNAPGSWGRIGIWWNPSDIEGFFGNVNFKVNDRLNLALKGGMYEGRDMTVNGGFGLSSDDEVTHWSLDLMYKISDSTDFWVGTEQVKWELADRIFTGDGSNFNGGDTDEIWYNVGMRYRMNDKAWWSLRWQISDYDANGVSGMGPFNSGGDRAKGGVITSTLSIKF